MSIKKLSFMLLTLSLAALLNGCGSSNREGTSNLGDVARVDEGGCRVCHSSSLDPAQGTPILQDFLVSSHNTDALGCQGCHGGGAQHNGVGPIPFPDPLAANRCIECHDQVRIPTFAATDFVASCAPCHTATGTGGLHAARATSSLPIANDCVGCHDVAAPQHGANLVGDNNGVRAITGEFTKWSHHVTGVNLQNAHCAACHLEGKVGDDGTIQIDNTYHMADAKTHLRNADTDADMQWDPAAPNHSTMDNFCMSCHDANGATSTKSAAIRALMVPASGKTASASNPFGDTISNRYDKMLRPAVVDVDGQFNTGNASHHAVKGPKYSGRTRAAGPRQITSPAAFNTNSSATLWGKRSTIYDSVNATTGVVETTNKAFNDLYVPLENAGGEAAPRTGAATLGDDSTLHCGDCHTVGQWKAGTAKFFKLDGSVDATKTSPAIGAHGSNNEYLLRNSKGTDERHTQDAYVKNTTTGENVVQNPNAAFLVCFNCHSYSRYGSVYNATGATGPHAGEYDSSGRCNGVGNTIPFNGYTTGTATDGTQFLSRFEGPRSKYGATPAFAPGFPLNEANRPATGEQNPDFGNIFGIQCNNCHNSGVENGYGGIHGSKVSTYNDGMGNTQTMRRFLPGLGNTKYVPGTLGGITGGTVTGPVNNDRNSVGNKDYTYITGGVSNDTNWEQVESKRRADGAVEFAGAGCYTLGNVDVIPTDATDIHQGVNAAGNDVSGPSVTGAGGPATQGYGTWGGCDDHDAGRGRADHGVVKRINRPITY